MINGHPKVQDTWARVVGYVEQVDIHSGGLTVEESLQFSAGLRLTPDVDERTRAAYILEVRACSRKSSSPPRISFGGSLGGTLSLLSCLAQSFYSCCC